MRPAQTVIELFTSQGCSSCPPADALLGELAGRDGVLALSLPVDYWDYLGWHDTLAKAAYSERQRRYARARSDGQVYTPQVVVNGLAHAVGSRPDEIEGAVAATQGRIEAERVPIKAHIEGDAFIVELGDAPSGETFGEATILLVDLSRQTKVDIKRGENGGRTVTYTNVVRSLKPIGRYTGSAVAVRIPREAGMADGADGCAVLLQKGEAGAIVAGMQLVE